VITPNHKGMDLRQYLTLLSIDPVALAAAMTDPTGASAQAGLEETSRRVLQSRSPSAMWDVLLGRGTPATVDPPAPLASEVQDGFNGTRGSLVVVGTGIRTVGQMTVEALAWIQAADVVPYVVADPTAENVIRHLNPKGAISLRGYYGDGLARKQSYESMVQHILSYVRAGKRTCAAFYGHPGVFAYPSHESIRRARQEGCLAIMLPGVSAEDCLFADLGVDPAVNGCHSFEATDFLLHQRTVDTSSQLILWQVGVLGDWTYQSSGYDLKAFPLLVSRLSALYGEWHECTLYEASVLPGLPPSITRIAFGHLTAAYVRAGTTMYVPPVRPPTVNMAIATAMNRTA
jgi:Tetrapyrrole (Corrin/Porphyrin) Methylases